ncbi:unnamed protein product [Rotaria sordida]|uniref:Uncharacterized protein n=1 Tax=Rotaria sordida TaxID=392033 RepID=A0A814ISM4_9BILA|nr:unnamed protein product [Rotaria sordida]CAF1028437.1 unnamed protein product [Rotaria sordida]
MISSNNSLKRKSSIPISTDNNTIIKRFRGTSYDGKIYCNEYQKSLSTNKSQQSTKKMTIYNSKQNMTSEYRQLQYELQCQEALLVLMQKLKTNQRIISQTNNTNQRTTTTTTTTTTSSVNTTKLNSTIPTKQPSNLTNRSTPTKPPHPNQYTVNRSNNNLQQQTSKPSQSLPQAIRQSTNSTLPITATRLSSTSTTKNSTVTSTTNNTSKNNGITTDQHLFNAKLALRKQLEQTLLQIPTPKPTICDLTYIPGINGWAEFLTLVGLEQAYNTYTDFVNRRYSSEISVILPYMCTQCGTDWSVTWHDISLINDNNNKDEKIVCDRCRKTSQKKILKQDHSNRLRQAFMKALQQEKELDAKFQQQSLTTIVKQSSSSTSSTSSSSHHKSSNKSLSTKINSNHQSNKHTNNNNNNNNNNHHHHSGKTSSSKHPINPVDTFASALAALPTNEQIELFQKHFLSNMFPFAVANQAAVLATKTTQQQQQALAASLPAMAASLMRQGNPAQYLLDMIPQAAKQHHRHSK